MNVSHEDLDEKMAEIPEQIDVPMQQLSAGPSQPPQQPEQAAQQIDIPRQINVAKGEHLRKKVGIATAVRDINER